jgi:ketosteroid isomerase-like protein
MGAVSLSRIELTRKLYAAYESGDRAAAKALLSDDFKFHAPPDPLLNRDEYFERCWPNAGLIESFDFVRLIEHGDEVVVTYESAKTDGSRYRNTEIFTFEGDLIREVEVYFGWGL